jgi:hypothetical protein
MLRMLMLLIAIAGLCPTWAMAQRVKPPAPNSTGNPCYESCMRGYTELPDRLVAPRAAQQCQDQCGYVPPRAGNKLDPQCKQKCVDAYNACMKASKNPSNDFNCPSSELRCESAC